MKLLWLNSGLLLPLDKGGKLRTWHVMRHLAARHDITYLSFEDSTQTDADRRGMSQVCSRLETVPRTDNDFRYSYGGGLRIGFSLTLLGTAPIWIDDSAAITPLAMRSKATE